MRKYKVSGQLPVVPTEFTEHFEVNGIFMEPGWYGVKIAPNGLESMNGLEVKHKDFETCKIACDIHNEFAGLSELETAQLYTQQRMPNAG